MSFRWNTVQSAIVIVRQAKQIPVILMKHAKTTLDNVASEAKKSAPVKTGALRRGIVVVKIQDGYQVYGKEYYTIYQEEGTRYFSGKFFMKNAITKELPKFLNMPINKLLGM